MAGDFCYVLPGTVKFHLRYCKAKTDYQMMANGTLVECSYGGGHQLVFQFVRGDGTLTHWSQVLSSCHSSCNSCTSIAS